MLLKRRRESKTGDEHGLGRLGRLTLRPDYPAEHGKSWILA